MKNLQKIFIGEEALKKLLPLIYISDELKNYIRTRYIAEKEIGSFENYFQHILLNVCHYHIQNAYTLALLNKKACIDLSDRSKMLFIIS